MTFRRDASWSGVPIKVPCGQCVGCRLEKSRQWAMRCMHEKKLHNNNCFITLTYDNDHLPPGGTLVKRDLQLFMKRLRKERGAGVRFYACGEYGDFNARPHYHAILFNCDFFDRRLFSRGAGAKHPVFTSVGLSELWTAGLSVVGDVTFESAAYVARYVMKKITGSKAADHYAVVDGDGVVTDRLPEFTVMSRRPGIGFEWFRRYGVESYAHDSVIVNGRPVRPPRYYDTKYELTDAEHLAYWKVVRRRRAMKMRADNTPDRRRVKEVLQIKLLKMKERLL
ncbi:replication protein VP4 [Gokushovirinae Fen672_31]|uniref:replication protein VP4 n=1 Tax=Gokushovirinae Fen672_31 TaxID=1655656 RepID=UPI00063D5F85|nr:replication protein VP4 [Gokushovirinae Fen672_31]AKI26923.1 replication protein VP4 [Gokushovirinae Fen672_31]